MITREQFIAATGHEPMYDDLDRCNCPLAGRFGHTMCGWDDKHNLPRFMSAALRIVEEDQDAEAQANSQFGVGA